MDLDLLETDAGYRQYFMDPNLWEGYVRQVCARHFACPAGQVRPGLAGTCPTFIVSERWVVKFFGRLFDGGRSFQVERKASRLLSADPAIPVPALLGAGNLREGPGVWPWPYLIYEYLPGASFGEVYDQVALEDKLRVAAEMGEVARRIHDLPPAEADGGQSRLPSSQLEAVWQPALQVFPLTWEDYRSFLQAQRRACRNNHLAWGSLPERLVDQLDGFLRPVEDLLEPGVAPHLIHADLTGDHLLGRLRDGRWETLGLIDFGDARVGSLFYELVALHLDLFRGDKRLLRAFLEAYRPPAALLQDFPARAMTAALLHQFNVWTPVMAALERQRREIASLEEFASILWDPDSPGLV